MRKAVNVELNDTARYGEDITLFPLLESGVAQDRVCRHCFVTCSCTDSMSRCKVVES